MNQVRSYSRRLKLPGAVTEQAEEYHRLAEVKCSSSLRTEPSLTLVCIDLACVKLGEPVNKKQLQCLSGQQPRGYLSTYQLVEKLLNVAGQVGVKELAMRFGNFEGEALADEILKRYRERIDGKYTAAQKEALDLTKPLYPAAALYCACKLLKIHCNKSKYQGASQSTRAMFLNVLEEINQCAPKDIDAFKQGKKSKAITISKVKDTETTIEMPVDHNSKPSVTKHTGRESFHSRIQSDPTDDTYLKWKDAILREAKKQLTDQTLNS